MSCLIFGLPLGALSLSLSLLASAGILFLIVRLCPPQFRRAAARLFPQNVYARSFEERTARCSLCCYRKYKRPLTGEEKYGHFRIRAHFFASVCVRAHALQHCIIRTYRRAASRPSRVNTRAHSHRRRAFKSADVRPALHARFIYLFFRPLLRVLFARAPASSDQYVRRARESDMHTGAECVNILSRRYSRLPRQCTPFSVRE